MNKIVQPGGAIQEKGISIEVTETQGHTYDYYSRSKEINHDVWQFLKLHTLEQEPRYTRYQCTQFLICA